MKRGELWWADLPTPPRAAEPGFRRPVLIVSSDAFNASAIRTVLVAVVTTNESLARAPGNVALNKRQSHLPSASVVNVSQVATLDKTFLSKRISALSSTLMGEVDEGLALVLALR